MDQCNEKSLIDFITEIKKIDYNKTGLTKMFKQQLVFRGQSNKEYELLPGIARGDTFLYNESNIIKELKIKKPYFINDSMSTIDILTKLQHFGAKTRLLDFTTNALVALYFACCCENDKDGKVSCCILDYGKNIFDYDSIHINIITSLVNNEFYDFTDVEYIDEKYIKQFIKDYNINDFKEGKKQLYQYLDKIHYQFLFPKVLSERQERQSGLFAIFLNNVNNNKDGFTKKFTQIKADKEIIINKEYKKEILKDLDIFGINKEFLFPDKISEVINGL